MNPHLAELARLSTYPLSQPRRYDWSAIEADLGIRLPTEYKQYTSYFPPGSHGGVIAPMHPALRAGYHNLGEQIRLSAEMYSSCTGADPLPFYPTPGGLIPWAEYESTAALCWQPDTDDPDQWPIIAYNDEHGHEPVPGTTIEALIHVLSRKAGRSVFPDTFYDDLDRYGDPYKFNPAGPTLVELGPIDDRQPSAEL